MRRPAQPAAPGPLFEALEGRVLASASPDALLAEGFARTAWDGGEVFARPGRWVVQLEGLRGSPQRQLDEAAALVARVRLDARVARHLGEDGLVLIEAPAPVTHRQLEVSLRALGRFRSIHPDVALWSSAAADDTHFSLLWGLENTGQTGGTIDADIDAPEAWSLGSGAGVVVGVIDTGVDYTHPDLAPNMWRNPGEIGGNDIDDDGNGYVDDVFGWNFYADNNNPMDLNGHGTHVAATIAAAASDGYGVAGVAPGAQIMALRFLSADGIGSLSGAIAAINYATMMRRDFGVDVLVTNNSWGGGGYSAALFDAIAASRDAGMLFVAAAGNGGADGVGDSNDAAPFYPAGYNLDNIISVAASNHRDQLAGFSNYGATAVDLAAPGVNIVSALPGGFGVLSGTSMAAPHVAGAAALAWGVAPGAGYAAVRAAILGGVDPVAGMHGKTATGGRLNAHQAMLLLAAPDAPPAAPVGLAAHGVSSGRIDLAWTDAAAEELGYRVYRSADGETFELIATTGFNAAGYGDTGLPAETAFTYRVHAYNAAGESEAAGPVTAATLSAPKPPASPGDLRAAPLFRHKLRLTWADLSENELGFIVQRSRDGRAWSIAGSVPADATQWTDSRLRTRTSYYYRVVAFNAVGGSEASSPVVFRAASRQWATGQVKPSAFASARSIVQWLALGHAGVRLSAVEF